MRLTYLPNFITILLLRNGDIEQILRLLHSIIFLKAPNLNQFMVLCNYVGFKLNFNIQAFSRTECLIGNLYSVDINHMYKTAICIVGNKLSFV